MELEEMQHQVEDLLKAVCGSQVTLADIALHKRQPDYSVVAARLEHPRLEVMVKLAGPRATLDCPFERPGLVRHRRLSMSERTWPN